MKTKSVISHIISGGIGFAAGMACQFVKEEKQIDKMEENAGKKEAFYKLLIAWVEAKQDSKDISDYFIRNDIKTIAVYGMRELGERLVRELEETDVKVKYIIDKNASSITSALPVYTPDDDLESVDAVVVTAIYYYEDIVESLSQKVDCQIISLEDVIYGV